MALSLFKRKKIGPYVLTSKFLGSGACGKVREGYHESTKERVAIKHIEDTKHEDIPSYEYPILQIVHHPNIVKSYAAKNNNIVMELVEDGTLYDYLAQKGRLEPSEARALYRQLISAMHHLHTLHFVHRDIKLENLLYDKTKKTIKLSDFGMASAFENPLAYFRQGTHCYMAPEVINGDRHTAKSDIWSSGVVLFVLVSGRLPFDDPVPSKLSHKIKEISYTIPQFIHNVELKDLFAKIFVLNIHERIAIPDIAKHSFFGEEPINLHEHDIALEPIGGTSEDLDARAVETIRQLLGGETPTEYIEKLLTSSTLGNESHWVVYYRMLIAKNVEKKKDNKRKGKGKKPAKKSNTPKTPFLFSPSPSPSASSSAPPRGVFARSRSFTSPWTLPAMEMQKDSVQLHNEV